ncbi:AAA domain-containing protein [Bacillus sp. Marseille-Q1617]|uniref:AAA domain-containing protein n=1 Tax=Bacillus sp. Marseille-Q1617 TaxID=2736887 RepID=UPI00158CB9E8|nr:AAA domain-containing protein [Bacillus sp. Marseille-Q1617]
MNITSLIEEWQRALEIEIGHLKRRETTGIHIEAGRCLRKDDTDTAYIYWFTLAYSASFPEGSTVIFKTGGRLLSGAVISSEERECIVEFDRYIGDPVTVGQLIHEPWELLEKLIERLEEAKERHGKALRIKDLMLPPQKTFHNAAVVKDTLHEAYLRSKHNPVTYLWGPPGTGKTYTLARVAAYHYSEGKRVLLLSHSNAAVDVLIEEMHHFLTKHKRWKSGEVIRYGINRKSYGDGITDLSVIQLLEQQDPKLAQEKNRTETYRRKLKKKLSKSFSTYDYERLSQLEVHYQKLKEQLKRREGGLVADAKVIGTTLSKSAIDPLIYDEEFDLVIVDEASMAYAPQVAFAASIGKKIIICGDFKQLPPIAGSFHPSVSKWLKEDIFHLSNVAGSVEKGNGHPQLLLLPEQRRMHPSISAFTNHFIYHSKVGDHPDAAKMREEILLKEPFSRQGSILLSLQEGSEWGETDRGSRWNILSSFITMMLVIKALEDGTRSIGIVTPYRAQARWYNLLLQELIGPLYQGEKLSLYAATVHGFQGSENDMIIFDVVDGNAHEKAGALLTRKGSDRLINVAVTRARGKFILVADDHFVKRKTHPLQPIHQLIDFLYTKGFVKTGSDFSKTVISTAKKLKWYSIDNHKRILKDLHACQEEIIVNVNSMNDIPPEIMKALKRINPIVTIKLLCKQTYQNTSSFEVGDSKTNIPFISLDKKVLWFNCFSIEENNRFPYQIRIFSKKVHQHFFKLIQQNARKM